MGENCITCDVVLGSFGFGFLFYVFTYLSAYPTPSGGRYFFTIHYSLFTQLTPFGDSIFLLVKKDRGERHAKGLQSRPLESGFYTGVRRGDVRTFLRIRIGAINAI